MGGNPAGPPIEEDMIGAIKIKDGLFIGDEFAAQVSKRIFIYLSLPQITNNIFYRTLSL